MRRRPSAPHLLFADVPTPRRPAPCSAAPASASAPSRSIARRRSTTRMFLWSPDYQRGDYVEAGGQPGSLSAWKDEAVNASSRDFFRDTLRDHPGVLSAADPSGFIDFLPRSAPRVPPPSPVNFRRPISPSRSTGSIAKPALPRSRHGASPDGRRRQSVRGRRGRPQRIPRSGGRKGARHTGVDGRPGARR